MMTYVPTISQEETAIRNVYALHFGDGDLERGYEIFDRWLAAHDAQIRAEVIDWIADRPYWFSRDNVVDVARKTWQ